MSESNNADENQDRVSRLMADQDRYALTGSMQVLDALKNLAAIARELEIRLREEMPALRSSPRALNECARALEVDIADLESVQLAADRRRFPYLDPEAGKAGIVAPAPSTERPLTDTEIQANAASARVGEQAAMTTAAVGGDTVERPPDDSGENAESGTAKQNRPLPDGFTGRPLSEVEAEQQNN